MTAREAKLRRLTEFRFSLPKASASALGAFLDRARKGDLPDVSSQRDIRAARDLDVSERTPYGGLIFEVSGLPM